jgi:hypothetical protein
VQKSNSATSDFFHSIEFLNTAPTRATVYGLKSHSFFTQQGDTDNFTTLLVTDSIS